MAWDRSSGAAVWKRRMAPDDWVPGLDRLRGAYADSTLWEAALDFRRFERWCVDEGLQALPAEPATLVRYVELLFESYSARTIENRLNSLRYVHVAHRLADPTRHEGVRLAFRRGVRAKGFRARQAAPLTAQLRDRLLAVCPMDSLIGRRDRVILSLGYDTLCRRSELARLCVEDVERLAGGGARVRVRRSKTDPFEKGTYAFLSKQGLTEVEAWTRAAGVTRGPIIRPVVNGVVRHRQMHDRVIGDRIQLLARRAGLEESEVRSLTAHSLRVGPAHDMAVAGRTLVEIMRAGRWRGLNAVALYVREAPVNVWSVNDD